MSRSARPSPGMAAACLALALISAACGSNPPPQSQSPAVEPSPSLTTSSPDEVAPTIVAQDPPRGGKLDAAGVVQVTFSEPVSGVDRGSFQLSDPAGAVAVATVTLDASRRTAILTPAELTIASEYTVHLAGLIRDDAGRPLVPVTWTLTTDNQVAFAAGAYTGYQFGATTAEPTAIQRATLDEASGTTATAYRVMDGAGYLQIDAGPLQGYWVHGTPGGTAQDDLTAPIPPLPTCAYLDLPADRTSYADWATSVLDTVYQLPSGYVPPDLVNSSGAGLNAGYFVRLVAMDDLSALAAAAKAAGAKLAIQSAYRSYKGQVLTFNGWVSEVGYDDALQTSARPGHSEHQLGTAIDFRTVGGIAPWRYADWATSTEGAWLGANAWRFGWVMSYPKGTSAVSCYRYEPWHYRYVGRDAAAEIHAAGVTPREWLWSKGYGVH